MKIAAVTNDGRTISAHFGRARAYVVVTVEEGKIVAREQRERPEAQSMISEQQIEVASPPSAEGHDHHDRAIAPIADCDVVLSRGMGAGMHVRLQRAHIRPILTDIVQIDEALTAFLEGRLKNRPDLVH